MRIRLCHTLSFKYCQFAPKDTAAHVHGIRWKSNVLSMNDHWHTLVWPAYASNWFESKAKAKPNSSRDSNGSINAMNYAQKTDLFLLGSEKKTLTITKEHINCIDNHILCSHSIFYATQSQIFGISIFFFRCLFFFNIIKMNWKRDCNGCIFSMLLRNLHKISFFLP